jgi:histidine triad (HIT) family protein
VDCIFCAIAAGAAEASPVFEDERVMAFLDINPIHRGHLLVVPREHVTDLAGCPSDLAGHVFAVAGRLGPCVVRAVGADGFNVWTANGSAAGQEVFHLHLHILPRFDDDRFGLRFPKSYPQAADRGELDALASSIAKELAR